MEPLCGEDFLTSAKPGTTKSLTKEKQSHKIQKPNKVIKSKSQTKEDNWASPQIQRDYINNSCKSGVLFCYKISSSQDWPRNHYIYEHDSDFPVFTFWVLGSQNCTVTFMWCKPRLWRCWVCIEPLELQALYLLLFFEDRLSYNICWSWTPDPPTLIHWKMWLQVWAIIPRPSYH